MDGGFPGGWSPLLFRGSVAVREAAAAYEGAWWKGLMWVTLELRLLRLPSENLEGGHLPVKPQGGC